MALYKGYSSFEYEKEKTFNVSDVELVKLDLLNHIFTRKTSRVMMPTFGTGIPDLLFDPLDEITIEQIDTELRQVFNFDPRVELIELKLNPEFDKNTVTASARLNYIELNMTDNLILNLQFQGI